MNDLERFKSHIKNFVEVPDEEFARLLRNVQPKKRHFKKDEVVTKSGFVLDGLFKVSMISPDGKEFIKGFPSTGQFTGGYNSVITRMPSTVSVTALEPSEVLELGVEAMTGLYRYHSCWQELGRKIAEYYFCFREDCEFDRVMLTPEERYLKFVRTNPHLVNRVKLSEIAKHIGITNVSLSRIRKRIV